MTRTIAAPSTQGLAVRCSIVRQINRPVQRPSQHLAALASKQLRFGQDHHTKSALFTIRGGAGVTAELPNKQTKNASSPDWSMPWSLPGFLYPWICLMLSDLLWTRTNSTTKLSFPKLPSTFLPRITMEGPRHYTSRYSAVSSR